MDVVKRQEAKQCMETHKQISAAKGDTSFRVPLLAVEEISNIFHDQFCDTWIQDNRIK